MIPMKLIWKLSAALALIAFLVMLIMQLTGQDVTTEELSITGLIFVITAILAILARKK